MKILITGKESYIGTNVEEYLNKWFEKYSVDAMDMIDGSWRKKSFAGYDVVYHVAGIAHSDSGKISEEKERLYRSVNTDLTIEVAKKASAEGVKQFIFMSSAIVYGDRAPLGKKKIITKKTKPQPNNCYSDSKFQAEIGLKQIGGEMKICILRPPMIYGRGSKGNYPVLAKFAQKLPVFPRVDNMRSMLYIENLCEFVRLMIDNQEEGIFWPQNREYSNTTEIVKLIAQAHNKKIRTTGVFNWGLYALRLGTGLVDKAFGSLAYDQKMSEYKEEYRLVGLEESIRRTEGNRKPQNKENHIMKPRALVLASVASMIDQFNMQNIQLLLDNGYQVDVITNFDFPGNISTEKSIILQRVLKKKGVTCYKVEIPRSLGKVHDIISSYEKVKNICNERQYSIVHCHSPIGGVIARLAARGIREEGCKVIYTAHGFHFYKGGSKKNWMVFYPIEKYFSKITDVLITVNEEDYHLAKNQFMAKSVMRIPGIGVDTGKFKPINNDVIISQKRHEIGIKDDEVMLLSVGELNANKNQQLVLRAMAKLEKVHYVLVGIGDKRDELEALAKELGCEDRVTFLGYRTDIVELNNAADIFAFPSIREGLGMASLEALACGTPVIGMNTRGIKEYVLDGETGYLFENNIESCKVALVNTIGKKKMYKNNCVSKAGEFSCDVTNEIMKSVYIRSIR